MLTRRSAKFRLDVAPPVGNDFFDDFNANNLLKWTIDTGDWYAQNQICNITGTTRFQNNRIRYTDAQTSTNTQYVKVKLNSFQTLSTHSLGLIFRGKATDSDHYQLNVRGNTTLGWERNDPDYVERMCPDFTVAYINPGDIIGIVVEGSGSSTQLKYWNFKGIDPDSGGIPDPDANWGVPETIKTPSGETGYVDAGNFIGLRSYRSAGSAILVSYDDFYGGDYR